VYDQLTRRDGRPAGRHHLLYGRQKPAIADQATALHSPPVLLLIHHDGPAPRELGHGVVESIEGLSQPIHLLSSSPLWHNQGRQLDLNTEDYNVNLLTIIH